jgi:hypothetical protein
MNGVFSGNMLRWDCINDMYLNMIVTIAAIITVAIKFGCKIRVKSILMPTKGLCSKRRNSPYIFQIVASLTTKA